jgi:hypothetical protein
MKTKTTLLLLSLLFGTASQAQSILTDGLTACYPFNGNASDESGKGNHGNVNGAVLTNDRNGVPGSAYLFDGVDDYIEITGQVIGSSEVSISFWAKTTAYKSHMSFMLVPDLPGDRFSVSVNYNHAIDSALFWDCGDIYGTGRMIDYPQTFLNTWEHYVMVTSKSKDSMLVYRNGILLRAEQTSDAVDDTLRALRIGSGDNGNYFSGILDDIRIYRKAVTASEVQQLYAMNVPCSGIVTSVAPVREPSLSIYPNPFSSNAVLKFNSAPGAYSLELYDALGAKVRTISGKDDREVVIRKDGLSEGIYFYRVSSEAFLPAAGTMLIH